jgi:hypothetical protein
MATGGQTVSLAALKGKPAIAAYYERVRPHEAASSASAQISVVANQISADHMAQTVNQYSLFCKVTRAYALGDKSRRK